MGKIDHFTIDTEKNNYKIGETVSGNLVVKVKEHLKINFIKLAVSGLGLVEWYTF
jgi:hypothetical protein